MWQPGMANPGLEVGRFNLRHFRRMLSYLKPYRVQVAASLVLLVVASLAQLAGPYLTAVAVDHVIAPAGRAAGVDRAVPSSAVWQLAGLAGLYLLSQLIVWAATYGEQMLISLAGQRAIYAMRQQLFDHLQGLSVRFFESQPTGVIMSRVTNDVNSIEEMLTQSLLTVMGSALNLVLILVTMLLLAWRLALVSFVVLPLLTFVVFFFSLRIRAAYREVRNKIANVYANLQESIAGVRVTQSFAREEFNADRFDQVNEENFSANMQAEWLNALFLPAVDLIGALGTALVLWYGGHLVLAGDSLRIGLLLAFLMYLDRFYRPVRDLASFYTQMQSAMAAAEKIFGILDTQPEVVDAPDARDLTTAAGRVSFEAVRFGYSAGHEVLHGIDFTAEPGMRLAIVGETGAGKSSLVNLLLRYYDPWSGRITLDGHDLRSLSRDALRRHIAFVPQETFLFGGSVLENIRYGRLEATDAEVEAAARAIGAEAFILRLPQGYQTNVEERGAKLSVGQRQMIAFARALLRNPRLLILDEATAHVDSQTEAMLQQALHKLLAGRTSLVIAHRLSTIRGADEILVLHQGRIVERGTHSRLLQQGGRYAALYAAQVAGQRGTA